MDQVAQKLRGRIPVYRQGNGHLTLPQQTLLEALGSPWLPEYPIKTGIRSWRSVRPDIANPKLKIAIEVDGASHRTRKQKVIDQKKAEILSNIGWRLLRFTNEEVMSSLETVLHKINSFIT